MPCLSHQFLLNKLLATTNTVCNISLRSNSLEQLRLKNEKEIGNFLLFKQWAKEKIMELSTASNFFQ